MCTRASVPDFSMPSEIWWARVIVPWFQNMARGNGPSGPILFSCEKSHFNKKYPSYSESTNSTKQKVHVGSQYSKTCLKQPLKKDKTKILIINGSLMKVESIAECSPWSILQYFWPALSDNWSSFLSGRLRQVLMYNQQSIYIYAYKCLCQCVGKVYYPNVNCG